MRFSLNINQVQCVKYKLTLKEGALMDLIGQLSTWADSEKLAKGVYYNIAYSKVIEELPLAFKSPQSVYRCFSKFQKLGLIDVEKLTSFKKNYIRLTPKGKLFFCSVKNDGTDCVQSKNTTRSVKNDVTRKNAVGTMVVENSESVPSFLTAYNNNTTNNKEREGENFARAIDFLIKNSPQTWEVFLMQNQKQIKDFEKFKLDFNDTVDLDGLEFVPKKLFARLNKYARNWIQNQNRYSKQKDEINMVPVYRKNSVI